MFKKIKPFVGKINRIVKKSRLVAYIELNDPADAEKLLKVETPNHPFPKGRVEKINETVNMRLYDEDDSRVLNGIAKIISQNPDMLKKTPMNQGGPMNKRPRLNGPGKISDTFLVICSFLFQILLDIPSKITLGIYANS